MMADSENCLSYSCGGFDRENQHTPAGWKAFAWNVAEGLCLKISGNLGLDIRTDSLQFIHFAKIS